MTEKTINDLTQRMAREYGKGKTLTQLAQAHGMRLSDVRTSLVDAGVTIRRRGGNTPTDKKRITDMKRLYLEERLTYQQIGDIYDLTRQRVQQILRGAGVKPLARRAADDTAPRKLTKEEKRIAALYDKGTRPADILDEFGITYSTLQTILRHANIPVKPKGFFNRRPDYERIHKGVVRDYKKGIDPGVITKRYGLCGPTEIYKFIKREGITPRKKSELA